MTEIYIGSIEAQIIGRVFTHDGAIHFVLGTDPQTGMARCSRRIADGPGISYLPMEEVRQILIQQDRSPVGHPVDNDDSLISHGVVFVDQPELSLVNQQRAG